MADLSMMAGARLVTEQPRQRRIERRPKHTWALVTRPFQIQPHCIAPVLPGETLTKGYHQSRAITDPLASRLVGWWKEYYYFYVKIRDLNDRDLLTSMFIDQDADLSSLVRASGSALKSMNSKGQIDYVQMCLDRVVETYFTDEGQSPPTLDGLPMAKINDESLLDSIRSSTAVDEIDDDLPGEFRDLPKNLDPQYADHFIAWQNMRAHKLTDVTFHDYLRSHGVRQYQKEEEERHEPELLRYVREYSYPSNVVEASATTSACVWSQTATMDKSRFFPEPGFIFGVTVARPKFYLAGRTGAGAGSLTSALDWLPAVLHGEHYTSLKEFPSDEGPCATSATADSYWLDMRDLFVHGDQFLNHSTGGVANFAALPLTATWNADYPSTADLDGLFAAAANDDVEEDGVVQFHILGHQRDHT